MPLCKPTKISYYEHVLFEVSIKYDQVQETGLIKKVTEKYLVEATSFTGAEAKSVEYIGQYVNGEYDITAIRRQPIAEIFQSKKEQADRWYKAKIAFITLDERSGEEKRISRVVMVQATDFDDARNAIQEGMDGTLGDWEKAQLSETRIVDVLKQ